MRSTPLTEQLHCVVQAAWSKMSTARTLSKGSTAQFSEGGLSSRAATSELSSQGVSKPLGQHLPAGRLLLPHMLLTLDSTQGTSLKVRPV